MSYEQTSAYPVGRTRDRRRSVVAQRRGWQLRGVLWREVNALLVAVDDVEFTTRGASVGCKELRVQSGGLEDLNIHANELAYDGIVSTGKISRKVESPIDKLDVFSEVLNNCGKDGHLSIYIGDSVGDLLCLLQADVGIVVGSSASLRRVGKRFGVSFVPLFSGVVQRQKEFVEDSNTKWPKGVLYTVSCWTEIHAFILGSSS